MRTPVQIASRTLVLLAIAVLPLVLLYSSIRTFREIDEQRAIYLRHRVALLAARLETLPGTPTDEAVFETFSQDEPYLMNLQVIVRGSDADAASLLPLWSGRELFRMETVQNQEVTVFRAYIPFHSGEGLRVARLDLNAAAADFLVVHARHNVIIASVSGLVLVLLSICSVWAIDRAARLRVRQLEMEHLAQIGKMAAVLAHEIRNPLGTIKGFVQLAGERVDEPTRDLLAPALAETRRLETLVNDLLVYGRPPTPQPKVVAWSTIRSEMETHARHMIGDRPIRFAAGSADFEWQTDPELLGQALLNLVRNAVEAIPAKEQGEVRIDVRPADTGGAAISVADTGPGISDEAMARLFEPFYTTKAFGTGLGLAITRKIVNSLGGELTLRRRPQGGSEAIIRIPGAGMRTSAVQGGV